MKTKTQTFLAGLIVLAFHFTTLAQTLDNALEASAQSKKPTRFSGFALVQHYAGFGDQRNEPSTLMFGQLNYKMDNFILYAAQFANKVYYVADENEPEIIFADTQLGILKMYKNVLGGSLQLRSFFTLPVSELSQRNGLISRPNVRFRNTWMFLDNKLSIGLGAELMYYWNQYTTTAGGSREDGFGAPMVLFRTALQSVVNYNLTSKISLSGYAFYLNRQFEELGPPTSNGSGNTDLNDFWYGLTFNYSFDNHWIGTIAFDHTNTLEQFGSVDFTMFDALTSQWSVGLNYIF